MIIVLRNTSNLDFFRGIFEYSTICPSSCERGPDIFLVAITFLICYGKTKCDKYKTYSK